MVSHIGRNEKPDILVREMLEILRNDLLVSLSRVLITRLHQVLNDCKLSNTEQKSPPCMHACSNLADMVDKTLTKILLDDHDPCKTINQQSNITSYKVGSEESGTNTIHSIISCEVVKLIVSCLLSIMA